MFASKWSQIQMTNQRIENVKHKLMARGQNCWSELKLERAKALSSSNENSEKQQQQVENSADFDLLDLEDVMQVFKIKADWTCHLNDTTYYAEIYIFFQWENVTMVTFWSLKKNKCFALFFLQCVYLMKIWPRQPHFMVTGWPQIWPLRPKLLNWKSKPVRKIFDPQLSSS